MLVFVGPSAARAAYVTAEGRELEADLSAVDMSLVAHGVPVRIPPSYAGQRHYPGLFWSTTNQAHVVYESLLELSWLWLADFDPCVVRLAAQPMRVTGLDGSRTRVRYPDFAALHADGRALVVDVKPVDMLEDDDVRASLAWTARVFGDAALAYSVWSGAPREQLRNVRLLASARRPGLVADGDVEAAVHLCSEEGTQIGHLERQLAAETRAPPRAAVFAAMWRGQLRCDMTRPISALTEVVPV
ncbi:hypothetical protein ASD18_04840 [Cellulomonas sp. Root137]|nr:hypothetical protein ASD18_04840 [Cellulomonas sp. Root137]